MHAFDRMCRAIAVGLLAVGVAAIAVGPADAQKATKSKAAATALPEPLTHESIRELVSRLSDEDVRKLLIDQLDRSAVPSKGKGDKAMSGMVEENAGMVRERLGQFRDAFFALPATSAEVVAKLDEPDGPSVLPLVAALVVLMLLVGWVVELLYDHALRNYRAAARASGRRNLPRPRLSARRGPRARPRSESWSSRSPRSGSSSRSGKGTACGGSRSSSF